ncbi:hypothetical protein [Rhodopila sp.]
MRLTARRVIAVDPNRDAPRREYPEPETEGIRQTLECATRNLDV